ncbi:MAG: sulfite oxidase heme-binding subunit YedZ [Vicinamibacterales bacterium]
MTQTQWTRRVLKPAVFLAALGPFGWLVYGALFGDLGVNPVETITNTTGLWTLRLLVVTILITPLRWLTGWNLLIRFRRMVGLFAFFYGTLHFMTYFVLDQSLMFDGLWEDVVKRPYITVGFTAFVLMIPLAITSTQGWIRRMGGKKWNLLHRLVYVSAVLGVLHYVWKVKVDEPTPYIYGAIVAVLLAARVWKWALRRQSVAPPRAARAES